jgi:dynein light intermediate chain
LNAILPPREFEDSAALWVQRVTSAPATRMDVITLQERLDALLNERQARETGICPVREELYAQCFDELIRQVTVTCAERGLLLLRVRDELRMSIMAYQTLYESSVAFGMRKALQTEQGKSEMAETIETQAQKIADLERREAEWRAKCEAIETREAERRAREETKHAEDIAFLNRANKQLKQQLDKFLQEPPAAAKK